MSYVTRILVFIVGAAIGLKLPDFDLAYRLRPLIEHRSLLTHGPLFPLVLLLALRPELAGKNANPIARLFLLGLCLASAVHLCFDLFPKAWRGYALIHVPVFGAASPTESIAWLSAGALVCLYLACRLLRGIGDLILSLAGMAACYIFDAASSSSPLRALTALVPLALLAFLLPHRPHDPDNPAAEISRWKHS